MKTLLDNTLIHRIGVVLESPVGAIINEQDVLAIFHFVEHILFSDGLSVSTFERSETQERTAAIVAALSTEGVSEELLRLVPFSVEKYAAACESASWSILDELVDLSPADLRQIGKLADESARPSGISPWPFHLVGNLSDDKNSPELWGSGAFLYTLRNEALRSRLLKLNEESALFDSHQIAALTALFRVKINQELARLESSLYAPAPQRARLSFSFDVLMRYRIERLIGDLALHRKQDSLRSLLDRLHRLDSLPLPALAIHFLRESRVHSPQELVEAACKARSTSNVTWVRGWLGEWEGKLASDDPEVRLSALNMLESWSSDLSSILSPNTSSVLASLRPGISVEIDQLSGNPSLAAEVGDWGEPLARLRRLLRRDRRFLAAVSSELATDTALGAFLLRSINRTL